MPILNFFCASHVRLLSWPSRLDMVSCKKCGTDHEKPIGNKCEQFKMDKEEQKDVNKNKK